ncbi:MAG: methyltransferase domain-containing protein [Catenulispora sp.]|nr:methyltransferase domain-containing protein [Catenulispora sp.]
MESVDPVSVPAVPGGEPQPSAIAARFDLWAPGYDGSILQEAFYTRLHLHALQLAAHANPAPTRLLDLGCGTGRLLRAAAMRFPHTELLGIDISAGMLSQAAGAQDGHHRPAHTQPLDHLSAAAQDGHVPIHPRRPAGVPRRPAYLRADAANLPITDAAIDVTICTATSHHWPDPEPPLAQLRRVTAADGLLILAHLPGIASWDVHPATMRRPCRAGTSPLTTLLAEAGFRITKAALYAECPVMPTTVVLCARPDTAPRPRGPSRLLRSGGAYQTRSST